MAEPKECVKITKSERTGSKIKETPEQKMKTQNHVVSMPPSNVIHFKY